VKAFFAQATTAAYLSLPRLIIADCMIPGMEAEDIVAAVRTVPAYHRVPVILFSTLPEAEGQRRYVQCGATAFVQKPWRVAGLCRDGGYDGAPLEWDGRRVGRPASKLAMTL